VGANQRRAHVHARVNKVYCMNAADPNRNRAVVCGASWSQDRHRSVNWPTSTRRRAAPSAAAPPT